MSEDEVKAAVDGLTKDVALSSDSIYDFVFWLFYHENNPFVMAKVKAITTLTIVVHILFIFYYLKTLNKAAADRDYIPYLGDFSINLVRLICAMLLHFQMYVKID